MRVTLKAINEALNGLIPDVRLAKGDGYFYFTSGETANWLDTTVRVPTLSCLTLEQWIEEFKRLKNVNKTILSGKARRQSIDRAEKQSAWPTASKIDMQVNHPARSKRERDRSRFPHHEPIGLHLRPRVDRVPLEREGREGNDPAASPCLMPTDCARSPRTSKAAPRVAVFAERPSSPEPAGEHTPHDSEVKSMRSYREIALDRCR
jgi:hypothetical protein